MENRIYTNTFKFKIFTKTPLFLFSNSISRSIQSENEGECYHDYAVGGIVDFLLILLSAWPLLLAKLHKLVEQWQNEAHGPKIQKQQLMYTLFH